MVRFETSRFGTIEIGEEKIVSFPEGILGFPDLTRYILLDYKDTPIKWLQAVDHPDVAFIVAEPATVTADWPVALRYDVREFLGIERDDDLAVLLILRVEQGNVVANLNGPLAINANRRIGVQAILDRA